MMGFGFSEIMILALLSGGQVQHDLVSFIEPQHYFQTRQVDLSMDKMMELAGKNPRDAKTQIMQLTALRYLARESGKLKNDPKCDAHRQVLEQIASGQKAQDSQGFAREYASHVLAMLDGTKPALAGKALSLRDYASAWFPADTGLIFAFDLHQATNLGIKKKAQDPLREMLQLVPDAMKKEIYGGIEKAGNIRFERFAMAMRDNAMEPDQQKMMLRFSGKGNPAWMAQALESISGIQWEKKEIKDEKGGPILILQRPKHAPILALIGNSDLVVAGYQKEAGKHEDLLNEILALRDRKQANAATGSLKNLLTRVPDKANALLAGELPISLQRELRSLVDASPGKVFAYIERDPQGLDIQLETTMANQEDSGKMVQKIGSLRKVGIKSLQQAQQQEQPAGFPPIPFTGLIDLMESLQVNHQADKVQLRVLIPDRLIQQLGAMSILAGRGSVAPPVVEVKEKK